MLEKEGIRQIGQVDFVTIVSLNSWQKSPSLSKFTPNDEELPKETI